MIGVAFVLQCIGAWQDSQTTDEAVHAAAGRSYWQTGDFRLNPEHPPLIKLLAAVPLLAVQRTAIDTSSVEWDQRQEWIVGIHLLYGQGRTMAETQRLMWLARLPMMIVWLGLAVVIFAWARSRWGELAGLVGVTVFAFDPNFLGHGHLVTTDVGVTLGFVGTLWLLDRFLKAPSWSRLGWLGLVFGLTQVTKFSAIILWLIVPTLGLIYQVYRPVAFTGRWWWRMMAGLVIMTSLVIWAVYGFEVKRTDGDPRIAQLWQERQQIIDQGLLDQQPPIVQRIVRWTDPTTATGRFVVTASHWPIPAYSYWRGLSSTLSHDVWGHPAYLLGQTSMGGWWYYFPVALLVKTPSVTLLLVLLAGALGVLRLLHRPTVTSGSPRIPFSAWLLGFPPLLYFAWSLSSHIDIGVRHIFPIEPFLFLAVGSLVSWSGATKPELWRRFILTMTLLVPVIAVAAWPNTIGYFSEIIGGSRQGYRYLLDSNVDWNQDIWRLNVFLQRHNFQRVHLVLFGSIPYRDLFPDSLSVLTDQDIRQGVKPSGIVAISAGQLYNHDGPFSWLRSYRPTWRVGSSITIYDFH